MNALFTKLKEFFQPAPAAEPDPMKYLIVGLGNPGSDYDDTRHNVGFAILDALASRYDAPWSKVSQGWTAEFRHKGRRFILLKPDTFMNLSGRAVRYWLQQEKVDKKNLLVVLDDLNLPFGKLRLRGKGSDGGHNGLKNIDQLNGGNNYARLRVGIGDNFNKGRQVNYVLGTWSDKEAVELPELYSRSMDAIEAFGTIGLQRAMSQHNG